MRFAISTCLTIALSSTAFAGPIAVTDPIPITGSGTWSYAYPGSPLSSSLFSISGTNGADTVSLTVIDGLNFFSFSGPDEVFVSYLGTYASPIMSVDIDGITSPYGGFNIGDGGTEIWASDLSGNVLATAQVIGYIETLVTPCAPYCDPLVAQGTITITSTPEPRAAALAGTVLFSLGIAQLLRHRSRPQTCKQNSGV